MTETEPVVKAINRSKAFHGRKIKRIKSVCIDWPKALVAIGHCARVEYLSDKYDGKKRLYFHDFDEPAVILAGESEQKNGENLLIIKGRFDINSLGIVG
jgi:hypothetical protein